MNKNLEFFNNTASTADNKVHRGFPGRSVPEVDFLLCAGITFKTWKVG